MDVSVDQLLQIIGEQAVKIWLHENGNPRGPGPNGHSGREVPLAEGDGQAGAAELSEVAPVPGNQGDEG